MDQPTKTESPTTVKIPIGLYIFVYIASICIGAFFGAFGRLIGVILGGLGGLVAAWFWIGIMIRTFRRHNASRWGVPVGIGWGIVAGLIATFILHAGLAFHHLVIRGDELGPGDARSYLRIYRFGCLCGVVAGALNGLVCGALFGSLFRKPAQPPDGVK